MPKTLVLIPTTGERQVLMSRLGARIDAEDVVCQLCGFGPIAAAARTARLINEYQPERILLIGIAGALSDDISPGTAVLIDEVTIDGIGAGSGDTFLSAGQMGWAHWNPSSDDAQQPPIGDRISLWPSDNPPPHPVQLLTVCAAAASRRDVRDRRNRFPNAVAEDMEGFSVALAARLENVPLGIVRGISNIAGDRDKSRWRIIDALNAAADVALELLK